MTRSALGPLSLLSVATLVAGAPAAASEAIGFDTQTGKVSTAGAAYALSFDDLGSIQGKGLQGYDLFEREPFDELQVGARIEEDAAAALEGSGFLAVGGDLTYVSLHLASAELAPLVGRRVEVSLWQKPRGTRMTPSIAWYGGDPLDPMYLAGITLQFTGEVTSDGWERWSSGPFDWAWAEVQGPNNLDLYDEAISAAYGGAFPDGENRALIDALTIVDLGPSLVPAATCALPSEGTDCGDAGLCHMGRCVDAALKAGQMIVGDDVRADYIDRRLFEMRTFEGGRAPRGKVDLAAALLEPLKANATAATFWPTFSHAYTLLVDGHASAPLLGYPSFQNAGVCVHEGEADLLPASLAGAAGNVVPLVFEAAGTLVGAQLEKGDALVRIDGMPTAEWASLARRLIEHAGDPEGKSVVTAPQLLVAAVDTGAVVTFARCAGGDDGVTPCTEDDAELITIDLGALVGDAVLAGQTPLTYNDAATCDFRFVRPVQSNDLDNRDGDFAGFVTRDGVRTLVINAVPGYSRDSEGWFVAVQDALDDAPELLILDQRTGFGGGIDAVDWLTAGLLAAEDMFAMDFLPSFEGDDLDAAATRAAREAVVDCSTAGQQSFLGCGNGFRWFVGDVTRGEVHDRAAAGTKLAVLNALDVSGNDYTSRLIKARGAETRFFGAGAAYGAYGVIYGMAAHMGELSGGSLQVQDTIFMTASDDDNALFTTSTGERPDTVVRQKQSDALAGKDTLIEAARAWLLEQ